MFIGDQFWGGRDNPNFHKYPILSMTAGFLSTSDWIFLEVQYMCSQICTLGGYHSSSSTTSAVVSLQCKSQSLDTIKHMAAKGAAKGFIFL